MEKIQIACVIRGKRQIGCPITEEKTDSMCYHGKKTACVIIEKRQIGCSITEKRQIECAITEKKIGSMCYHGKKDRQHVLSWKKDR